MPVDPYRRSMLACEGNEFLLVLSHRLAWTERIQLYVADTISLFFSRLLEWKGLP